MTAQDVLEFINNINNETPLEDIEKFYQEYRKAYKNMSPDDKYILSKHWDKLEMLFMLGS